MLIFDYLVFFLRGFNFPKNTKIRKILQYIFLYEYLFVFQVFFQQRTSKQKRRTLFTIVMLFLFCQKYNNIFIVESFMFFRWQKSKQLLSNFPRAFRSFFKQFSQDPKVGLLIKNTCIFKGEKLVGENFVGKSFRRGKLSSGTSLPKNFVTFPRRKFSMEHFSDKKILFRSFFVIQKHFFH